MSKKTVNNSSNSKNKKKVPWSKKTGLQKGATITNWGSVVLLALWFVLMILKFIGLVGLEWSVIWGFFLAATIVGFGWFFVVLIAVNVFHKR